MRTTLGLLAAVIVLVGAPPALGQTRVSPVDQIIARCPTAAEIAAAQARTPVTFDVSALTGPNVCTAGSGSTDLNTVQLRTYQALIVLNELRFSQALPWTPGTLTDWFSRAIRGIRITDLPFGTGGFCCNPAGVIVVDSPGDVLDIAVR